MPKPDATASAVKISKKEIKDADGKPVAFGESQFSKPHWDKLKAKEAKEKDLLDKLSVSKDGRKAKA